MVEIRREFSATVLFIDPEPTIILYYVPGILFCWLLGSSQANRLELFKNNLMLALYRLFRGQKKRYRAQKRLFQGR